MALTVLALPLVLVVALASLVVGLRRSAVVVGVGEHAEVVRIARHTRSRRALGLVLGLVLAGLLLGPGQDVDALGRLTALAPVLVGVGVLAGTVVGELTARPAVGVRRSATIETRTVTQVLPRGRAVVLAGSTVLLAGALGLGVAWGAPDDLGRPGRAFAVECTRVLDGAAVQVGGSHGPWPGSFYAAPIAAALLAGALLVLVALRAVVRRPRPGPGSHGLDTLLRRWSAGAVLTAATFTVLATLGPVALLMAAALAEPACPSALFGVVHGIALATALLALAGAAASLGALLVTPTIRVDDLPRPSPGDAAPVGAPVR